MKGFEVIEPTLNVTEFLDACPHSNSLVALTDADNFTLIDNETVLFNGNTFNIIFYDKSGNFSRPVICIPMPVESTFPLLVFILIRVVVSLSIIASIVLLLTFSLFRTLKTLPGQIVMNLAVSFLFGDIAFLVTTDALKGALWGLLVGSYFFSTRFMWMALVGFEICRNIYRGIKLQSDSEKAQNALLATYLIIGWGLPLVPTAIMVAVENSDTDTATKSIAGIFGLSTYFIPIGLTVLFNIGVVIFLSVSLHKASVRQKKIKNNLTKNQTSTNFARVFLIVLTALGLTWILIFAAILQINSIILETTIVIVNASQPIFVSIAFIGTKKVAKEYLKLCGCGQEKVESFSLTQNRSQNDFYH